MLIALLLSASTHAAVIPCSGQIRASFQEFTSRWSDRGPVFDTRLGFKQVGDRIYGAYSAKHIWWAPGTRTHRWNKYVSGFEVRDVRTCALVGERAEAIDAMTFTDQIPRFLADTRRSPDDCSAVRDQQLARDLTRDGRIPVELEVYGSYFHMTLAQYGIAVPTGGTRHYVLADIRQQGEMGVDCAVVLRQEVEVYGVEL